MLSKGSPRNLGGLAISPDKRRRGSPETNRGLCGVGYTLGRSEESILEGYRRPRETKGIRDGW
ncbi:MAG: hypothetical protein JRJ66_17060 [Deltaproteobacteria bacterium]|nr:hypothetical protein [Deltaproteobacteria bacterium]